MQQIKPITKLELRATISRLKSRKAPGYDLISPKILKELPEVGISFILYIFNAILRNVSFPIQWKTAQIKMILKPGKPPDMASSYRPISLLPILSKVLETLLLKRIQPIIDEQKLIPDHQFGFRQKHSTIEQVNRVFTIARRALEEKEYCTAAFVDITQAFDKVWHPGLLYKIRCIFPDNIYQIIQSYLTNRFFMVKVNNEMSHLYEIFSGVPQGSVLGPVLYLIFTADLPLSANTYTATFADDTVIMAKSKYPNTASDLLQENLKSVEEWMKLWRIKANELKSSHITFTLKRGTCPKVKLNGNDLPQNNEVKYLGIHLDEKLTWQSHIMNKRKQLGIKLRSMIWLLGRTSKLSLENKILIYKAILKPVWTYGIQLWGSAAVTNIAILQRFQNKILRTITNAPWYLTNNQLHSDLDILSVEEEIKRYSSNYIDRLKCHLNPLARDLTSTTDEVRRLNRYHPIDLALR